jgi:GTP-binding protein HflX
VVLVHQRRVGTVDDTLFDELTGLALAAGAQVLARLHARRHRPEPGGFLGKGKTLELAGLVESHCATLVIVDQRLSPIQERNMERVIRCRVIDRTRLILDIFALRARSREGQLQVELAQLRYLSTRLVRGWSHLERQRGGIGLRGPGEMQLETDRRLLGSRISRLKKQLERVRAHRSLVRRGREKLPLVSMVGYTNAGKSSLFNGLTGANVLVADQLFATLDSTIRKMEVAGIGTVLLSDTVGFIQGLPTTLIEAFRGTL